MIGKGRARAHSGTSVATEVGCKLLVHLALGGTLGERVLLVERGLFPHVLREARISVGLDGGEGVGQRKERVSRCISSSSLYHSSIMKNQLYFHIVLYYEISKQCVIQQARG